MIDLPAPRDMDADALHQRIIASLADGILVFDLSGKTLGVVGAGHIGEHMIRMGNGFNMKVLGFDVHQDPALAAKYTTNWQAHLKHSDSYTGK